MRHSRRRRLAGLVLAALVVAFWLSPPIQSLARCPDELRLLLGEEERLDLLGLPFAGTVRADREGLVRINDKAPTAGGWRVDLSAPLSVRPLDRGRCNLILSLFGVVPLKRIAVEVVPRAEVTPGGQSIGILLRTRGVAVVGHAPVEASDGSHSYPARDAGVRVGDVILKIDAVEVRSNQHIVFLVNRCAHEDRAVPVELERDGQVLRLEVTPGYSAADRTYQLGLYVRDGAAGVGTLTFYEPESGVFMALGHVIADSTTNRPLEVADGRVVKASVAHVKPGRRGEPGEKEGTFVDNSNVMGTITSNTEFGLVGTLEELPEGEGAGPIPVALAREVRVGPAEIRTVVHGNSVESFGVEITDVDTAQNGPAAKGITLRVIDPRLIDRTGGIVQGMSGSPIIQDGRLVGAVTHVFVNDPTRGYGVFAEWMVRQAGLYAAPSGMRLEVSRPALAGSGGAG